MSLLPYTTLLLAEQERMQDLYRAFRAAKTQETVDDVIFGMLIFAGIAAVMIIFSALIQFRRRRRGYASPLGLFFNLCRAHKLKWRECWLLWRLARLESLTDPARLFLEPEWFVSSHLPEALRLRVPQLQSIRNRLFADLSDTIKLSDKEQSSSHQSIQPKGAALPELKAAPELDIAPWPATALSASLPPHSNSSDGAAV
jgi:hypothetical protein